MKLDQKDRVLLAILTKDASLTNRALAERIGLSPSACLARVKQLEKAGAILGYRAITSGSRHSVEGWIDLRLIEASNDLTQAIANFVDGTDEIQEAHRATGASDYLLRFVVNDISSLNAFKEKLATLHDKAHSRFSILLNSLK